MALLLTGIGVFLIIIGLYGKYIQYKKEAKESKEPKEVNTEPQNNIIFTKMNEQQQQLKLINSEMDNLIKEIREKEKLLIKIMADLQIKNNCSGSKDFKEILEKNMQVPEKYRDVIFLIQQGLKAEEIAERLNLGIRETRLIIKLYRKEADKIVGE